MTLPKYFHLSLRKDPTLTTKKLAPLVILDEYRRQV